MSRGPVGPDRQELLVGCSRFFVFPAIAEHPSAQIGDFFFFGLQIEGTAGAVDCNIAAPLMVERLTQLAIDPGALVIRNIAPPEINQACLEVARKSLANDGLPDLANVAQLGDNLGVAGRVSPGESWRLAALGEIAAPAARPWQSLPRPDRRRMFGRTHICLNAPQDAVRSVKTESIERPKNRQ